MEEILFSLPDAAKLCAVSRWTLWSYVKSGELNAFRTPGGHYRISEADLEKFMSKKRMRPEIRNGSKINKILVVDDDPAIRKLLLRILSAAEFKVEPASDGFEAGLKIAQLKPDLVFLDIFMPHMDGFEVCQLLKNGSETKDIKIIAISGDCSDENQQKIANCGADTFLSKPLNKSKVLGEIDRLLNKLRIQKADRQMT